MSDCIKILRQVDKTTNGVAVVFKWFVNLVCKLSNYCLKGRVSNQRLFAITFHFETGRNKGLFLITVQFVAGVWPELGFASNYSSFQSKDRNGIRVCFSLWFNLTQRGVGRACFQLQFISRQGVN